MVFGLGKSFHSVPGTSDAILTTGQRSAALNYYLRFPRTSLATPAFCSRSSDVAFVSTDRYVSAAWELIHLVYIFVGSLVFTGGTLAYIAGSIVIFIGIGYVVLEFTPQVEPPSNMRDGDAGWGAEQV